MLNVVHTYESSTSLNIKRGLSIKIQLWYITTNTAKELYLWFELVDCWEQCYHVTEQ